ESRLFLESTARSFDIIQIVSAEEMAAETRGATGLSGDYVLTTEGLRAAWLRLAPHGILTVTRGIQIPQRDVFKLATTLSEALNSASIPDPDRHVIFARNYLANLLLAFRDPLTSSDLSSVHKPLLDLGLDVDWPRELSGATSSGQFSAGSAGGLPSTTEAVAQLFSSSAAQFIRDWMYDIRPATDDRPYFRDFFRVRSIGWMKKVYRDQWYQRVELGFAILLLALVEVILLAAFVLLIPAFVWWKRERGLSSDSHGKAPLGRTLLYFFLIGIGFMALEINCIARAEILVGDPVFSATLVISVLLAGAGIGSALSAGFLRTTPAAIKALIGVLFMITLLSVLSAPSLPWLASLSLPERGAIVAMFLLPLGLSLGFFFPIGLRVVRSRGESLVPWAWGANGFASVAGPPLVTVIAMSAGHQVVFAVAAVSYLLAVLILPRQSQG
ncbi:MAG TPA: hypothetical protein VLR94_01285, partial [Acidobacteriota bacterium]|nr:hypothetical protein [Acidobacteriota bacterium]